MGMYTEVQGKVVLSTKEDYKRFVEWLTWHGWVNGGEWLDVHQEDYDNGDFFDEENLTVIFPIMSSKNRFHNVIDCFINIQSYVDHTEQENINYDKDKTILRMYSEDGGINVREFVNGQTYDRVNDGNYEDLLTAFGEDFKILFELYDNHSAREIYENAYEDYMFGGTILEEIREVIEEWMDSWSV
jgi:hypothetical protein